MLTKIQRFLYSIGLDDIERFDLSFVLTARNPYNKNQIDMAIEKTMPWEYGLLDEFIQASASIKYPYTLRFTYLNEPNEQDAAGLFYDWYMCRYGTIPSFSVEKKEDGVLIITYPSQETSDKNQRAMKDFRDLLSYINYPFRLEETIHVVEAIPVATEPMEEPKPIVNLDETPAFTEAPHDFDQAPMPTKEEAEERLPSDDDMEENPVDVKPVEEERSPEDVSIEDHDEREITAIIVEEVQPTEPVYGTATPSPVDLAQQKIRLTDEEQLIDDALNLDVPEVEEPSYFDSEPEKEGVFTEQNEEKPASTLIEPSPEVAQEPVEGEEPSSEDEAEVAASEVDEAVDLVGLEPLAEGPTEEPAEGEPVEEDVAEECAAEREPAAECSPEEETNSSTDLQPSMELDASDDDDSDDDDDDSDDDDDDDAPTYSDEEARRLIDEDADYYRKENEAEMIHQFEARQEWKKEQENRERVWTKGNYTEVKHIDEIFHMSPCNVEFEGEIFQVKYSISKSGKGMNSFAMGDETNAIGLRAFEGRVKREELEKLDIGQRYRVRGAVDIDKFTRSKIIIVHFMNKLPKKEFRKDEEPVKRVELHLHTNMSTMDSVASFKDYYAAAKAMGMRAIGLCDHGAVQSFPAAQYARDDHVAKLKAWRRTRSR